MHRKRVTCELHDSFFRSMTITHAIPKTAEMTHSNGQLSEDIALVSLADNMRQGKKSHHAVTKWCTGREWPVNCMTVISARWRSHMPFKRRRKWHIPMARYRKKLRGRGGHSISLRRNLKVKQGRQIERKTVKNSTVHESLSRRYPVCVVSAIVYLHRRVQAS